jgi:hypothetical protein
MCSRIYTYKITFEEVPHWYWGVHKEKKYNDGYMGSPVTHKWMWNFYTPKIQILEIFPYTEKGWIEAVNLERRLIVPDLNKPFCLNERVGAIRSWAIREKACKLGGEKIYKEKRGIHGRTPEQMTIDSNKANKRPGGLKCKNNGLGIFARKNEEKKSDSQKGAASTNSQRWMSTADGFISTPGNVAKHNKANGWDPAARIKIGGREGTTRNVVLNEESPKPHRRLSSADTLALLAGLAQW